MVKRAMVKAMAAAGKKSNSPMMHTVLKTKHAHLNF
jgi:hypothetical protein